MSECAPPDAGEALSCWVCAHYRMGGCAAGRQHDWFKNRGDQCPDFVYVPRDDHTLNEDNQNA